MFRAQRRLGFVGLSCLSLACTSTPSDSGGTASSSAETDTTSATESATDDSSESSEATTETGDGDGDGDAACPDNPVSPGLHSLEIEHGGETRVYDLYIPTSHDGTEAAPVVFNLHPLYLGGALHGIWTNESGMNDKAEAAGFIAVQPDGTGEPASWNAGADCCAPANTADKDDIGLVQAIAAEIESMVCVDRKRIYAVGMSNGGYLSHRLACEASQFVAAIGPVVGSLSTELECDLERAVPVMQVSGSEDNLASREQSFQAWRDFNGCTDEAEETYNSGSATCMSHDECDDGVSITHCVVWGGGHCWFSDISPQFSPGCDPTTDLITPDLLWDFLSQYSLP